MDPAYRHEILSSALSARVREVTEYEVNIDNFRLALEVASAMDGMEDFVTQLRELLASSVRELRKAQIMHDVIRQQLEAT
jgi:undecaprenyl pyrophosphate synthase